MRISAVIASCAVVLTVVTAGMGSVRGLQGVSADAPGQQAATDDSGIIAPSFKDEHDTLANRFNNPAGHVKQGQAKHAASTTPAPGSFSMTAHGGRVMGTGYTAYFIYYNWDSTTLHQAKSILEPLMQGISATAWFNINKDTYTGSSSYVAWGDSYVSTYTTLGSRKRGTAAPLMTSLSDQDIVNIVDDAIRVGRLGGGLPKSEVGYFVLTGPAVTESSGFCTNYCGWHTSATYTSGSFSGTNIKYAFIGNPSRCMGACAVQQTSSPNNAPPIDAMASVLSHELVEMLTDPNGDAYYDTASGYENGDACAWTFQPLAAGSTDYYSTSNCKGLSNGSKYNLQVGSNNYLIQQNWVNNNAVGASPSGFCAMSYP